MSVNTKSKDGDQYTVYLVGAGQYTFKREKYIRGDEEKGHFTGTEEECNHLMNQKQFGVKGEYIWGEEPYVPPRERAERKRTITKKERTITKKPATKSRKVSDKKPASSDNGAMTAEV